jgi:hypothetical protein
MELALVIMMALGIFVAIPAVIGFTIAGIYILRDRRVCRMERARAVAEAVVREPAKEKVPVV